jgi:hypothetical protein
MPVSHRKPLGFRARKLDLDQLQPGARMVGLKDPDGNNLYLLQKL